MFRFAHPEYLIALWIIPLIIILFWYFNRNRKKLIAKFAEKNMQKILIPGFSRVKHVLKFAVVTAAITLLILAAANPQIGTKVENVKQTGIDVFILLDVSLSMTAQDIKPSRLEKAKHQIANLIQRLQGDRIGLIIFAGDSYIQFPLTTDYSAANLFLSAVSANSVPRQGTAIASAVNLAVKSFKAESSTEKAIIVITDGEDHEGDVLDAVEKAVDRGIKIYAIGLGTVSGAPIPVYDKNGNRVGFKKDDNGNIVVTRLNPETLKKMASAGNGEYFQGSNYDDHLEKIYNNLSSLEKTEFGVKKVTDYEDRFYYFLAAAIILLLLDFFMTEKKSPKFVSFSKKLGIE